MVFPHRNGPDEFAGETLKECVIPILQKQFQSVEKGDIPNSFYGAIVILILKPDERNDITEQSQENRCKYFKTVIIACLSLFRLL